MENEVPKFRQSCVIFKKQGYLYEKSKTLTSFIYLRGFFSEPLHTFPT